MDAADAKRGGPLLEVRDLRVWFPVRKGVFARTAGYVKAVDGVSFDLRRGETLGVVGESGCGKSTTSRAILGLVRPTAGTIRLDGTVQAVFQDPLASLNPRHTVVEILTEALVCRGLCRRDERRARATELLARVGLSDDALDRYPHEFSGGQRQRICIARAVALKPDLLICDEAVSALDLSVRAQVLDLLADLRSTLSLSYLFITHDIGVVRHIADRVLVMNAGRIVEQGPCARVLGSPSEPYTRALVDAVPRIGGARPGERVAS